MQTAVIQPDFESWREAARKHLAERVSPDELVWDDGTASASLFGLDEAKPVVGGQDDEGSAPAASALRIPKAFMSLARLVACHREPRRWDLLYHLAWRLTRGGEPHLLRVATDPQLREAEGLAKTVRRDRHKMTAFVRFRKVGEHPASGREQFVAWFEPDHDIVELTAPFFAKRFAGMDWSILTPDRCAHWDGERLHFTGGVSRTEAPDDDELEDYWRSYYASIFNPARLKLQAMRAEMPKKYWKNLPEAPLIAELSASSGYRTRDMIASGPNRDRAHVSAKIPAGVPEPAPTFHGEAETPVSTPADHLARADVLSLDALAEAADACRACPLHAQATQTVFGAGPGDARIMIVGEQPGDQEDIAGRPFVGPAGHLLDRALAEAGLDRDTCYLTNTVKHFKWVPSPRGQRRLHKTASAAEVQICKPWVIAEALKVRPEVLICLGATAAKALIRSDFRLVDERGLVPDPSPLAPRVIATVHPSAILRLNDPAERAAAFDRLAADLRLALFSHTS